MSISLRILLTKFQKVAVIHRIPDRGDDKPLPVDADQRSETGQFDVLAWRRDEPATTLRRRDRRGASLDHNPADG